MQSLNVTIGLATLKQLFHTSHSPQVTPLPQCSEFLSHGPWPATNVGHNFLLKLYVLEDLFGVIAVDLLIPIIFIRVAKNSRTPHVKETIIINASLRNSHENNTFAYFQAYNFTNPSPCILPQTAIGLGGRWT